MKKLLVPSTALLWGLQYAFLVPVIGLLLTNLYGASPAQVGWALTIYNAAGFVSSVVLPGWADRRREYLLPTLVAALLTVALATVLWWVSSLPLAVAALVVLGGPAGMGAGLLFAHLRHAGFSRQAIVNTRSIMSFAWVAGPPIATFIMGSAGDRAILPTLLILGLGNLTVTWLMIRQHQQLSDEETKPAEADGPTPWGLVIVVAAAMVLLQATNVTAVSVMGLHVTQTLGLDLRWAGVVLGTAAAIEIPMLIWVGRLSLRFASVPLLLTGAASAVAYYVVLAVADSVPVLIGAQLLNAYFFAVVGGLSLTWFQEVLPRPGLAATISGNVRRIGGVISGPMIAFAGFGSWGWVGVWWLCAALAAISLVAMWLIGWAKRDGRGQPDPRPSQPSTQTQ